MLQTLTDFLFVVNSGKISLAVVTGVILVVAAVSSRHPLRDSYPGDSSSFVKAGTSAGRLSDLRWTSAIKDKSLEWIGIRHSNKASRLCNPHDYPGVLYLDPSFTSLEGARNTAWLPLAPPTSSSALGVNGSQACPPQNFVQRLASGETSDLPRELYNRTILLIGDSIDRNNLERSCELVNGEFTVIQPETKLWPQPEILRQEVLTPKQAEKSLRSYPRTCYIASIDLFLVNVYHFGLDEDEYFVTRASYKPPYKVEDRLRTIAAPLMDRIGRSPDIVTFSSGLWSLSHMAMVDQASLDSENITVIPVPLQLSQSQLSWYMTRLSHTFALTSSLFPTARFFTKTVHTPPDDTVRETTQWWAKKREQDDDARKADKVFAYTSAKVYALNEAIRATVSAHDRWDVDNWGEKLVGRNELYERGDPHPAHAASTLWLEQTMYRLLNL